jgi:acylpyruvate hydrolase
MIRDMKTQTIYGIGRNYADHAAELGNVVPKAPIVFLKAASSIRGLEPSPMAFAHETFHHEVEVVVRVAQLLAMGSRVDQRAISHLALGLDLTRREAQSELKASGLPWTVAKSFKGATVLGPWIDAKAVNLESLSFDLSVNGELRQSGNTSLMLHSVETLLNYLLSFNDLYPGDLIFTGTPQGVGPIRVGDRFEMRIASLGYRVSGEL